MFYFSGNTKCLISVVCILFLTFSSAVHSKKYKDKYSFNENIYNELKSKACKKGSGALYKDTFKKILKMPKTEAALKDYLTDVCSMENPKYPALGISQCEGYGYLCPDDRTQKDHMFNVNYTQFYSFKNSEFSLKSDNSYNNSVCYTRASDRKKFVTASRPTQSKAEKQLHARMIEDTALKCVGWHKSIIEDVVAKLAQDKKNKIAAEKKRKKAKIAQEKKRKKAEALAEKERKAGEIKRIAAAEKAKKLKAKRAAELETALALPTNNATYMIWSGATVSANKGKTFPLNADLASLINLTAWDKTNSKLNKKQPNNSVEKPVFIEPVPKTKGEYEKTAHFNKRVADDLEWARTKYHERIELYKQNVAESNKEYLALVKNKDGIFMGYLIDDLSGYLDEPQHSLKYDADKEVFLVTINSKALNGYSATGTFLMPIDQAPAMKIAVQNGKPHIVYQMINGKLNIQRIVLETDKRSYRIDNVSDNLGSYVFTEDAANKFRPQYEASLKQAEDNKKQKLARKNALIKEREIKRQKEKAKIRKQREEKYGHSGPFLEVGATMCTEYKSMYKAMAIVRANNPYVSTPEDCITSTPKMVPITKVKHMTAGISQVILKDAGVSVYVTSNFIIE